MVSCCERQLYVVLIESTMYYFFTGINSEQHQAELPIRLIGSDVAAVGADRSTCLAEI